MLANKISTIEELEIEQQKLRMGMKVTKDAFAKSLGTNRKELSNYLVKRVAIPAGIAGAGLLAAKKMTEDEDREVVAKSSTSFLGDILPLAIDVFQTFLLQKNRNDISEMVENQENTVPEIVVNPELKPTY